MKSGALNTLLFLDCYSIYKRGIWPKRKNESSMDRRHFHQQPPIMLILFFFYIAVLILLLLLSLLEPALFFCARRHKRRFGGRGRGAWSESIAPISHSISFTDGDRNWITLKWDHFGDFGLIFFKIKMFLSLSPSRIGQQKRDCSRLTADWLRTSNEPIRNGAENFENLPKSTWSL